MDDDWDADDFTPVLPILAKDEPKLKSQWDDEDLEEEPKEEEKPKPVAVKPKVEKKKEKVKKVEDDAPLSDPLAEKLRQQRLVEEADYQHTSELFGGKQRGGRSLEGFIPKSEDDFLEYAELLAQKLRPFEVGYPQPCCIEAFISITFSSIMHVPSTFIHL
ncbi:hypothetical protein KC19_1G152800 [Ceratodon purpureus]|uniref:Eukaryotic translation initiation factor 3 30 kDa subunit n=1 Tax=Ceratodon purpureus TaxID=3225 RepID=A0A8T0J8G9_CERPU|nr:hypothetical protein KC19_1G152800 [Ceratodon purpureus]